MRLEDKYFEKRIFTAGQISRNLANALKDIAIAKKSDILDVKFNYAYTALLKGGIAILSFYGARIKSVPGHHVKILEKTALILKDDAIIDIGNIMRSKRNLDLYAGGIEVSEKECREYLRFVGNVLARIAEKLKE